MVLTLVIIVSFRKFYLRILLRKFLAKPRYATFQKNSLKIAHIYNQTMSWEGGCNLAPQAHGTLLFLSPCCMLPFPSSVFLLRRKFLYGKLSFWVAKNSVVSVGGTPSFWGFFWGGTGVPPQKKTKSPPKKKKKSGFNGKCVTHFPFTIPRTLNNYSNKNKEICGAHSRVATLIQPSFQRKRKKKKKKNKTRAQKQKPIKNFIKTLIQTLTLQ